jgi:AcrR family transcriptional regulator
MEDIARQAGLSKGALYLYYKSKDAIIAALLNYFFAQEFKRLQALVESDRDVPVAEQLLPKKDDQFDILTVLVYTNNEGEQSVIIKRDRNEK